MTHYVGETSNAERERDGGRERKQTTTPVYFSSTVGISNLCWFHFITKGFRKTRRPDWLLTDFWLKVQAIWLLHYDERTLHQHKSIPFWNVLSRTKNRLLHGRAIISLYSNSPAHESRSKPNGRIPYASRTGRHAYWAKAGTNTLCCYVVCSFLPSSSIRSDHPTVCIRKPMLSSIDN